MNDEDDETVDALRAAVLAAELREAKIMTVLRLVFVAEDDAGRFLGYAHDRHVARRIEGVARTRRLPRRSWAEVR